MSTRAKFSRNIRLAIFLIISGLYVMGAWIDSLFRFLFPSLGRSERIPRVVALTAGKLVIHLFPENFPAVSGAYYAGELQGASFPERLRPGEIALCFVEVLNTGRTTWLGHDVVNSVRLGTWNPMDHVSPFYDPESWISPNRLATLDQEEVRPGEMGRFTFKVVAPQEPGVYDESLNLVCEYVTWFQTPIYFSTVVE